ncbi:MAG: hypothetical protein WBM83_16515 [Flavobacteriaceae bacterium]
MKTSTSHLIICLFGSIAFCLGQEKKETSNNAIEANIARADTTKQMNVLDEQAKILGSIFGNLESEGENPFDGTTNYLELIEKMDGPEADKRFLREQYKLYDLSLDPKKKEEFKIMFNKKLKEAMDKGQIDQ